MERTARRKVKEEASEVRQRVGREGTRQHSNAASCLDTDEGVADRYYSSSSGSSDSSKEAPIRVTN